MGDGTRDAVARDYVELHCRSAFSLLAGASLPEQLVARAVAVGLPALALTDRHDLGGAVRFAQAARAGGLDALVGAEVDVDGWPGDAPDAPPTPLVLLAESREGYGHVSTLISRARLDRPRGTPAVTFEQLAAHAGGVHVLTGGPEGRVPALVARGTRGALAAARATVGLLRDAFDGRVAVECWDHGLSEERALVRALVPLARAAGVPWTVAHDVRYAEPALRAVHDVLAALRHGRPLDAMGTRLAPNDQWHLQGPAAMRRRWAHAPAGLRASVAIAERCTFRMDQLRPSLPAFPLPPGVDADAYLRELVATGAQERWGERITERHHRQLAHELAIIRRLGLAGYFLIVWDIVRFARREGILCQGRGSAANSAVCYCLGITAVDPIAMDLLFERFLSEEREEAPDIDLDFAHRERERVLQYVYARYGRAHAAMVCEQITWRGRSAVRDAARALGFSVQQGDALAAFSDRFSARATADALRAGVPADAAEAAARALGRADGWAYAGAPAYAPASAAADAPTDDGGEGPAGARDEEPNGLEHGSARFPLAAPADVADAAHPASGTPTAGGRRDDRRDGPDAGTPRPPRGWTDAWGTGPSPIASPALVNADANAAAANAAWSYQPNGDWARGRAARDALRRALREEEARAVPHTEPHAERNADAPPRDRRDAADAALPRDPAARAAALRLVRGTEATSRARAVSAQVRTLQGRFERARQGAAASGRPELRPRLDRVAEPPAGAWRAGAAPHDRREPGAAPDASHAPEHAPTPTPAGDARPPATRHPPPADSPDVAPRLAAIPRPRVRHGGPRDDERDGRHAHPGALTPSDRPLPGAAYEPYGSPGARAATGAGVLARTAARAGVDGGAAPAPWTDPHADATHEERRNPTTGMVTAGMTEDAGILARAGLDPRDPRVRVLADVVDGLHQLPRHRSIHVGGFVLTAEPLATVVPVEPASMAERTVIQWEKDDLDPVGLVKIDLLGLGMLTVLQDGLKYLREGRGIALDLATLPMDDPAVYEMLCRADSIGVFQVESRAQMNTLPRLKPRRFYDLVVQVALIRPGPIQGDMVHPYLRRRAGTEAVTYPHPALRPALERTLGVPLFQEQGMQVAIAAAGFTPGEADELRRAMGHKRSRERMAEICERLVAGMARNGIPEETARRIYNQINAFADYGFPESHAASFAHLVYASAYLKHHYPAEFLCALLNAQPMGFYAPGTLIEDARRHGVRVLPVDVTVSEFDSTLEWERAEGSGKEGLGTSDGTAPLVPSPSFPSPSASVPSGSSPLPSRDGQGAPAVRLGLRLVRGLGARARTRLEDAVRAGGPFRTLDDLVRRSGLDRRALRVLAEAGALDAFVPDEPQARRRRAAVWRLLDAIRGPAGPLAPQAPPPPTAPAAVPAMSAAELTAADYRVTGLSLLGHPMRHLRATLAPNGVLTARDAVARGRDGERVAVAGLVICRQRPGTARGFVFLTLEDETGTINVVITPQRFARDALLISTSPLLLVRGRLQVEGTAPHHVVNVRLERCRKLDVDLGVEHVRSHDYH